MYILTIYSIDNDIEVKWQGASTDEMVLKRAALKWAMPYGLVEPEITADLDADQQAAYVTHLASDQVNSLFKELHSYLNDGAGADDPRIMLRKAEA